MDFHRLPIPVDRDLFVRSLLREFTQSIVDKLGEKSAGAFVAEIGAVTGGQFDAYYRAALKSASLTRAQVAEALVDVKRRIQGDFYVVEQTDEKIVLRNRACPFGNKVLDRPALCMMTSSVFGAMASKNLGYAKVELKETIARRHGQCHVVVYLKPTVEAAAAPGREFTGTAAPSAGES
jgi:predicted ArsR family transcriptional regulator